jgi:hypothetical protein
MVENVGIGVLTAAVWVGSHLAIPTTTKASCNQIGDASAETPVRPNRRLVALGKSGALMDFNFGLAFEVAVLAAIGGALVWLGKNIEGGGTPPARTRKILAWPFIGLGVVFGCLAALDLLATFFGGLALEGVGVLMWLRSFF